ncbi:MAG: hypothetical protein IJM35_01680 [Bacteroidales bacterium]|nr:hypothetical protein [Bacteroidales bacterium]
MERVVVEVALILQPFAVEGDRGIFRKDFAPEPERIAGHAFVVGCREKVEPHCFRTHFKSILVYAPPCALKS